MIKNHKISRLRRIFGCNLLLLIFTLPLTAQDLLVTGRVTDGNLPISGASIIIKNTMTGTVSDFDGRYSIIAKATDTLEVSYLGYTTVTVPVQGRRVIDVTMQEDATALGEVRINAGYYTTTDREKTGSIARITAKEIEQQPVSNPLAAMQGRLSGVDIVQNSGVPGGGFEVRIRGQNSILAGNAPLYIIDGIPYDSATLGSRNTSLTIIPNANISPLNAINPASIQSIEVLKDADATAIYGSRGANGVVLITTKKGTKGKTRFNLNASTGMANITNKINLLNTEQYLQMRQESFDNDGITSYPSNAHDVNGNWATDRYTDWQDVLVGNDALITDLQTSVSGGSAATQFLLSGMVHNETTVFPGEFNYKRINVTSNLNHQRVDKRLEINFNTAYTMEDNKLPGTDLFYNATRLAPNAPALYTDEGNLNWQNSTWTNPLAELEGDYRNDIKSLLSNLLLSFKISENLLAKVNMGYTTYNLHDFRTYRHTMFDPAFGLTSNSVSRVSSNRTNRSTYIVEPQLNWQKKHKHSVFDLIVGATFQSQQSELLEMMSVGFVDNTFINNLNAANTIRITGENKFLYNYQSIFARIGYAFKDKFFLNATGRRDGSSRFGPGNKYGNFGALGAAYIFSEDLNQKWLNLGKLRSSYGITGNDQINDYQYLQTYGINNINNYDNNLGLDPTRLFNPDFKWEQNKKMEVALELGLFNNRVNITAAYYSNRSVNQLINYTLPGTTGFTGIQSNLNASIRNSGWEFDINVAPISSTNFHWQSSLTFSIPKNELLAFPNIENTTYANQYVIGKPLTVIKLYKYKGVNPETGLFEFEDFNNDGAITSLEDRKFLADLRPQFFGGISNTLKYKNWGVDIFFQWVKKDSYNQFYNSDTAGILANQPVEILDRWQQPGDMAFLQQFTSGSNTQATAAYNRFKVSSAAIADASFLRLKTLALSYQISMDKDNYSTCRIILQGQNLLTFTNFENGDPEQTSRSFIPPLRRITLGVQLQL